VSVNVDGVDTGEIDTVFVLFGCHSRSVLRLRSANVR
jgi:hypothetical protein